MSVQPNLEKLERRITASILRLQTRSPFFATLALFTNIHLTEAIPAAATDGRDIFIHPQFIHPLSTPALEGLLLHEVLHTALLHGVRRQARDAYIWNVAADIVVNGMVAQQDGMEVPKGAIQNQKLEHLSVEEIYDILITQKQFLKSPCTLLDLQFPWGKEDEKGQEEDNNALGNLQDKSALEAYWRDAMQQAMTIAESSQSQGSIPTGFQRELGKLTKPQIDWRTYLWRFMVKTPTDFSGFDRRFIGQNLYLDVLDGESVKVYVAIDTSGSVENQQLRLFLSELLGIVTSYPHLECELYYADANIYGPYELTTKMEIPKPVGGGGTSFEPFFKKLKKHHHLCQSSVGIYLTDGFGTFPKVAPELPILWVVTPGGLDLTQFPFGEAVRLLTHR